MAESVAPPANEGRGADAAAPPAPAASGEALRTAAFWVFLGLALALIAAVVLSEPYVARRAAEERLAGLRAVNGRIADVNERLKAEADAFQHDPFYLERLVRLNLRYQRPGERVIPLAGAAGVGTDVDLRAPRAPRTWFDRYADLLVRDGKKRAVALLTAGILMVVAFLCFCARRAEASAKT